MKLIEEISSELLYQKAIIAANHEHMEQSMLQSLHGDYSRIVQTVRTMEEHIQVISLR
jgi:hypothetical protein